MPGLPCPICRSGTLERQEARLDQSGHTHLRTVAFRCPRCEYARFEPAVRGRWVANVAPVARVSLVRKAVTAPGRPDPAEPLAA
jgi:hypothetical protein